MKLEELSRYGVTPRREQRGRTDGPALRDLLPGKAEGIGGTSFVVETAYEVEERRGPHDFGSVRELSGQRIGLACRDPELSYADLPRAVFLDTETTGLGMGTGTYVFLLGAGYLQGSRFVVRQYFLDGPQDERLYLNSLAEFLSDFPAIVTFNGKAFDWPLITNRFIRWHRLVPIDEPPHIDLLHPARRLWKRRLESCSLSSLERGILGLERTREDVPGYEIPARYFRYLRTRRGAELTGVFYHNLQDVLSLATLAVHIDRIMAAPFSGLIQHGIDFVSLGRWFERSGDAEYAGACYLEALERDLSRDQRRDCLIGLAGLQKRERQWEAAIQTWDRLVDEGGTSALFGLVELAKYHEHVERDYASAIEDVQQAILLTTFYHAAWAEATVDALEHRLARLMNRVARTRRSSWSPVLSG